MNKDVETGNHEPVKGFPSLARFVAGDGFGHSTYIFRPFFELSARNLLHLQCQVAELEAQQALFDEEDFQVAA